MATRFVSAVDGNNADNGTTWALAKQTVAGALAIASTGDIIVVDNAGVFTANAAITWSMPSGSSIAIISVARSGASSFAPSAGATEQVGASNSLFLIQGSAVSSGLYVFGMVIKGGANNNASCNIGIGNNTITIGSTFESCTFDLPTANDRTIILGGSTSVSSADGMLFINCTFLKSVAGAITQYFFMQFGKCDIVSPTFNFASTMPTHLFGFSSTSVNGVYSVRDGDISGFSGTALILISNLAYGSVLLENLKLHSTPNITAGSWPLGNGYITIRNCDDADTTYVFNYIDARGTLTADAAVYQDNGAAFDGAGVSWKIVTTSVANETVPFTTPAIYFWNTALSAQTAEIEIIRDNATLLTDRDIWSDFDYAASASFPNYTCVRNRNAEPFTGTGVDHATSTAVWTGVGGFTDQTKQKLEIGFTAAAAGLVQSRVSVGVASTTLYIDPFISGVT